MLKNIYRWLELICIFIVMSAVTFFASGAFYAHAQVDAQAMAAERANQILDMLGPHGIFAIIGTIVMVRILNSLTYTTALCLFITTVVTAVIIGALSTYFNIDGATQKQILGGAFMTAVGSPIAYEVVRWLLRAAMALTRDKPQLFEFFQALYWFLSPKPVEIKVKNGGDVKEKVKVQPHKGLTDATQFLRMDKRNADKTQFLPPEERAGENFDPDITQTPNNE